MFYARISKARAALENNGSTGSAIFALELHTFHAELNGLGLSVPNLSIRLIWLWIQLSISWIGLSKCRAEAAHKAFRFKHRGRAGIPETKPLS
eukprot:s60_g43.t1